MGPRTVVQLCAIYVAASVMGCAPARPDPMPHYGAHDFYAVHINEAARRFDIPAKWIVAVMHAESAGDPRAISPAGAIGLMQIMPGTWAELRARHRLGTDPHEPRDNILAGTAYLRELLDRFGTIRAMLAAYNAGPGRYEASRAGHPLPRETHRYVAAIEPIIRGELAKGGGSSTADAPRGWRAAPLFAGRRDRASTVLFANRAAGPQAASQQGLVVPDTPDNFDTCRPRATAPPGMNKEGRHRRSAKSSGPLFGDGVGRGACGFFH